MVLFIGTMLCSNSSEFIIQAIAIKIQSIPVFWCRIFAEHAWQQSLKTGNFLLVFIFRCFLLTEELFWAKKLPAQIGGANQCRKFIVLDIDYLLGQKCVFIISPQ